jgi:hypothetical protein
MPQIKQDYYPGNASKCFREKSSKLEEALFNPSKTSRIPQESIIYGIYERVEPRPKATATKYILALPKCLNLQ